MIIKASIRESTDQDPGRSRMSGEILGILEDPPPRALVEPLEPGTDRSDVLVHGRHPSAASSSQLNGHRPAFTIGWVPRSEQSTTSRLLTIAAFFSLSSSTMFW